MAAVLLLGLPLASAAAEGDGTAERPLVVGTHEVPPFVIRNADGSWDGISMATWRHVADELGLRYQVRDFPVKQLLDSGEPDVIVSLNILPEREEKLDLTHAFYSTGLAIAVPPKPGHGIGHALRKVLTPGFGLVALVVFALLLAMGALMWLVERRANDKAFGGKSGWLTGLLWAIETVVHYKNTTHATRTGRVLGIVWAMSGVVLISGLTARLSSEATMDELTTAVAGPDDLHRVRVGTVRPSQGALYCDRRGLACSDFLDARAALDALAGHKVDAVVYEAPILQYFARTTHAGRIKVLPGTFDNHGYGFGLRLGSPLRKKLDIALLRYSQSDAYRSLLASYLGPQ
jgi:ABC-type amino acid transport substrate-binding protein